MSALDDRGSSTGSSSSSAGLLSNTTDELFAIWNTNCLRTVGRKKLRPRIAALQAEAAAFFTQLSQGTTVQVHESLTLHTKASHSEALARLIRSLGEAFLQQDSSSSSNNAAAAATTTRWAALSCLVGALQGCRNAGLSNASAKLLSEFLLPHAGPIMVMDSSEEPDVVMNDGSEGDDEETDDFSEPMRDTALLGLTYLVQSLVDTTNATTTTTTTALDEDGIQLLIYIAQQGVERRCAEADSQIMDTTLDYPSQSGLSLLPRSRRSLCFDLLRATVNAFHAATLPTPLATQTLQQLTNFCLLIVSCLHGESDPRCLLQLLQLFDALTCAMQGVLGPAQFPVSQLFDAIAPYYPIQFEPPPNDPHGITKADLRNALVQLLSCTTFDDTDDNHPNPDDHMSFLACQIILECVLPPPEDGPPVVSEQIEALQDLQAFLFARHFENNTRQRNAATAGRSNCHILHADELSKVSDTVLAVHATAARAVAERGADNAQESNQILANLCRSLMSKLALALEVCSGKNNSSSNTSAPWKVVVENPVRRLAAQLNFEDGDSSMTTTMEGRIAIAYMAGLASSGGFQTLRICLEFGLGTLLRVLRKQMIQQNDDDEKAATALYGIGAFASSCLVSLDQAGRDGVYWHPHPLQPYSVDALDVIGRILLVTGTDTEKQFSSVQIAAMRALESLLRVAPPPPPDKEGAITAQLEALFRSIASGLVFVPLDGKPSSSDGEDAENPIRDEFLAASARALGSMLGQVMSMPRADSAMSGSVSPVQNPPLLVEMESLRKTLLDEILPMLIVSTTIPCPFERSSSATIRNDRVALAVACTSSLVSAHSVVQLLMDRLHQAVLKGQDGDAIAVAETLASLFDQTHPLAARAFQELKPPSPTVLDLLVPLAGEAGEASDHGGQGLEADFGMSNLQLPKSTDRKLIQDRIDKACTIIEHLRKGYEAGVTPSHLTDVLYSVDNALPPLSDSDTVKLSFILPILSAAMENASLDDAFRENIDGEALIGSTLTAELADFALDSQNDPRARSHAARCLHASIARFLSRSSDACPAQKLAVDKIWPILNKAQTDYATATGKIHQQQEEVFLDALSILALLGSAAACRGGVHSSKTADEIVLFLVTLACNQKADFPFAVSEGIVDLKVFNKDTDNQISTRLSMICASSFGSILSTDFGNQLWKQRLTHISVRRILECITNDAKTANHISLGAISAVCYVVCSSSMQHIPPKNHQRIADIVISGLLPSSLQRAMAIDIGAVSLLLAALVKLLSVTPALFQNSIYHVVTGTMHAYAIARHGDDSSMDAETTCKLLAFQALASAAQVTNTPKTLLALQPAVVSVLGAAMNHPSGLLRHAAVEVKNTWDLLE